MVLETSLDDVSGEVIGYVFDRLFEAGALEVFASPIYMKKNRPGTLLTVLAPPELRGKLEGILFSETPTLGIRGYPVRRTKLCAGRGNGRNARRPGPHQGGPAGWAGSVGVAGV